MKREYPVIDMAKTGQNIKRIMHLKGFSVKDLQKFLELNTSQSIYHWFDGRNLPTIDNLYALSELFQIPVDAIIVGNRKFNDDSQNNICHRIYLYFENLNERIAS